MVNDIPVSEKLAKLNIEESKEFAEEIKSLLECPVCKIIPRKLPILQCENGNVTIDN